MIEVDVRQENVVDVADVATLLTKPVEKKRYAVVGARVDEGAAPVFHNQVAGILQWAQVLGIDGDDAIVEDGCAGLSIQAW